MKSDSCEFSNLVIFFSFISLIWVGREGHQGNKANRMSSSEYYQLSDQD